MNPPPPAPQPRRVSLFGDGSAGQVGSCLRFSSLVYGAPGSGGAQRGSPVPRASGRAGAELGPPLPNLAHFFQARNLAASRISWREGVSSLSSLASGRPAPQRCRVALPGRPGGWGEQRCKALPRHPSSPCLAGYQCMGGDGGRTGTDTGQK